jgi:hypothetical protein
MPIRRNRRRRQIILCVWTNHVITYIVCIAIGLSSSHRYYNYILNITILRSDEIFGRDGPP